MGEMEKLFSFLENDVNFKSLNETIGKINCDRLRQLTTEAFVENYFSNSREGSIFYLLDSKCQDVRKISPFREMIILYVLSRFVAKDHHVTFFADLLKSGFFHHKDNLNYLSFLESVHICHLLSKCEIEKILTNRVNGNYDFITKNLITFIESNHWFDHAAEKGFNDENGKKSSLNFVSQEYERRFKLIDELLTAKSVDVSCLRNAMRVFYNR